MISLVWLKLVPWRAIGAGAAVVAVVFGLWRISEWRKSHLALPEVRATLAAEVACEPLTACQSRAEALARQAREEAAIAAQAALGKAQEAEAKARADASAWRRRYEAALRNEPECKAWSEQRISCPL